jgi:hypothetical protein
MWRNLHATAITKQRATGDFARRINRDNGQSTILACRNLDQPSNQRAFPNTWGAGDTNNVCGSRQRSEFIEKRHGFSLTSRAAVFEKIQRGGNRFALEAEEGRDVDMGMCMRHK